MRKQLLIGITGGIGSGKSLICKIFQALGIPVYYADDRAKWLMNNDESLRKEIIKHFGEDSYKNEQLNRSYIAGKVFNNEKKLELLNSLVHPAVGRDFFNWIKENDSAPYLIKEAALIFESGSYKNLNYVVNVYAPAELRVKRIMKRDPFRSREQIEDIIKKQATEEERIKHSDLVINNDGQHLLIPQVLTFHKKFLVTAG